MCSKMNVGVHARIKSKFIDLFFLIYGHKKLGGGVTAIWLVIVTFQMAVI